MNDLTEIQEKGPIPMSQNILTPSPCQHVESHPIPTIPLILYPTYYNTFSYIPSPPPVIHLSSHPLDNMKRKKFELYECKKGMHVKCDNCKKVIVHINAGYKHIIDCHDCNK